VIDRAWVLSRFYRVAYQGARVWWFLARPKMRGVKCVITRGDEVLLVRHTYGDRRAWELPGGSIKRGEEPLAAARRETLEELGLAIPDWIPLGDFFAERQRRTDKLYCFHAMVEDVLPVADRVEIAETGWFSRAAPPAETGRFVSLILSMSEDAAARRAEAAALQAG
jgi:8-oxo-dGTP pyrophosphatase MutT (NUDIX family)